MRRKAKHDSPFSATLTGILDLFDKRGTIETGGKEIDIRGKRCLVTGATSGLGKAVAIGLAERGGIVTLACRRGFQETAGEIKASSGNDRVETEFIDLSKLETVRAFCRKMEDEKKVFDIVVLSAGVATQASRKTEDGFDEMFQVNFLANVVLVNRLLKNGSIRNSIFSEKKSETERRSPLPRIVFVSSESHRTSRPIDFSSLGIYRDYGMTGSLVEYGYTKLLLSTYAVHLSRLLSPEEKPEVSVHFLCPGPVNSNISRESPAWMKPLLKVVFTLFFQPPRKAAIPVLYLCTSAKIEGATGVYMHMKTMKPPAESALEADSGKRLWEWVLDK